MLTGSPRVVVGVRFGDTATATKGKCTRDDGDRWRLAATEPARYTPDLADALPNLGAQLLEMKHHSRAVSAIAGRSPATPSPLS